MQAQLAPPEVLDQVPGLAQLPLAMEYNFPVGEAMFSPIWMSIVLGVTGMVMFVPWVLLAPWMPTIGVDQVPLL